MKESSLTVRNFVIDKGRAGEEGGGRVGGVGGVGGGVGPNVDFRNHTKSRGIKVNFIKQIMKYKL